MPCPAHVIALDGADRTSSLGIKPGWALDALGAVVCNRGGETNARSVERDAARTGLPVLTNDDNFDRLQQLRPQGTVIFY
jgi:hypothetical protein